VTTTSSNPAHLTNVNGTLYFAADDGAHGYELWKSDGTTAGTTMVEDLYPGSSTHSYTGYSETRSATLPNGSSPSSLTNLNGTLLFSADDGVHGTELWVLPDGTTSPPSPTVRVNDVTVTEGNTGTRAASFIVTLSAPSSQPVTVAYATADSTALAGSDYQAVSGTLTIPAGQTTGTITVQVIGDRLAESNETFSVNLSSPTNATIADGQGIGAILDDEPRISINDVTVTEGNTGTVNATFTVSLSVVYDVAVTVHYQTANGSATAGSDYAAASGDVIIAAGQTTETFMVAVFGDRSAEPTENFVVNLSAATNGLIVDSQGVGTILDDEPRISIGDVTRAEGKKGQTTLFTFTVTLSAAYDQAVTMSFRTVNGTATTGDGDYVGKTGTLTFAPGETTKTITITVNGDRKKEADEYFYLDLFGNSGNSLFTKNRGVGTILNDD
jgi:ELWxxDGT repeat protein